MMEFRMSNKPHPKKIEYRKPELIRINLLEESAAGDTFPAEEPPFPAPPPRGGSTPPDSTVGGFGEERRPV